MTDYSAALAVRGSDVEIGAPSLVRLASVANDLGAQGLSIRPKWAKDGAFLRLWVADVSKAETFERHATRLGFHVSLVARHPDGVGHDGWQICVVVTDAQLRAAQAWAPVISQATNELGSGT